MQMEDRSWMYESGDVLVHFKGVSIFLEAAAQHATRAKEEAIYCPFKVWNNNMMYLYKGHEIICKHLIQSGFMDNYFIWSRHGETQPMIESIIDEREEENMNADHVYSHHDEGGHHDDVGEHDEGLEVEELMRMLHPMCCYNVETRVLIIWRHLIKRRETFFMSSVKGAIRSTWCCG
jgi:hypothetical protein